MRLACLLWTLAWFVCIVPVWSQEAATDAQRSPEVSAALEKWRTTRQRAAQVATLYRNSNADARNKVLPAFLESMEEVASLMEEAVPVLEVAYAQNPNDAAVNETIENVARICLEMDQVGYAYRMARLLAQDTSEPSSMHVIAGQSAFEMGEMEDAQRYLQLAEQFSGLNGNQKQAVKRLRAHAEQRKTVVSRERERLTEDAQAAEPLPRIKLTTSRGDVVIELFEDDAPNTVASLIALVEKGFYNDKTFFRVEQGFGAVTGSPTNDGAGGPGYETMREESPRGARPHLRGYVSMLPMTKSTNGSQFFIVCRPSNCLQLDGRQDVVGRIVEGIEVIERLRPYDLSRTRIDIEPEKIVRAEVVAKRGRSYIPKTTLQLAEEAFRRALQQLTREEYEASAESFRQSLQYHSKNAVAHFNLGVVLIRLEKFEEAESAFRASLRINPRNLPCWQGLFSTYVSRGDIDGAVAALDEGLRIFPGEKSLQDLLAQSQQLKAAQDEEAAELPNLKLPSESPQ